MHSMKLVANTIVLCMYLLFSIGAALCVARRKRLRAQRTARPGEAYFLGGRDMRGWQLGCSLVATQMSSVTFLAYPASSFATNWLLLNNCFTLPLVSTFAAVWVVPYFRSNVVLSAYELLETRFNPAARLYCAFCYCLLQLARTCTVLYLVSFPLVTLSGANQMLVIVLSGVLIAVYTVLGGFAAVVFTDVVQAATLLIGGLLTFGYCVAMVPGGFRGIIANATAEGKFSLTTDYADAGRSPPLLWLFSLCIYILSTCMYQDTVQRYCAASSLREARVATVVLAVVALPIWAFFMLLGTALYAFSRTPAGASLLSEGAEADSVVSSFALNFLPAGAGGVVLAGVLAAAMSSLDSSMNAVAAVVTTEWVRFYMRGAPLPEARLLAIGRRASLVMAALTVLGALALIAVEKEGMNDLYNGLMSITGGASGGLMLLVIFTSAAPHSSAQKSYQWYTPHVDGACALVGVVSSCAVTLVAASCSFGAFGDRCSLTYYWLLPLSNGTFMLSVSMIVISRRLYFRKHGMVRAGHVYNQRQPDSDDSGVAVCSAGLSSSDGGASPCLMNSSLHSCSSSGAMPNHRNDPHRAS